jgi:hypothetical protein
MERPFAPLKKGAWLMKILRMMTGGGRSVEELADMVRQFGRGRDKILAHITPEEAAKLKEMGGRGTINPMTGLPEFQDDSFTEPVNYSYDVEAQQGGFYGNTPEVSYYPDVQATFRTQLDENKQYIPGTGRGERIANYYVPGGNETPERFALREARLNPPRSFDMPDVQRELEVAQAERMAPVPTRAAPAQEEGFLGRTEGALREARAALDKYPMLTRAGSAIGSTLGQALMAARANRQRDAMIARERERAAPFRAAEAEALDRARAGGMTASEAQALETELARARQGLSARNMGTGSAAAGIQAGQRSRAQSVARQQSFAEALRLAGVADAYERRALEQELAKDTELAKLFADVVGREITQAGRTQAPAPTGNRG